MLVTKSINLIQRRCCQNLVNQELKPNLIKKINLLKRQPKQKSNLRYLLYLVPITTFGLGTWQVQRRRQKLELIATLEERLNLEPQPLPADLRELKDHEYKKFIVKGKFDHSREIVMQPRSRIDDQKPGGGIFGRNLRNGAWIITPLKLSDRNYSILVNRGWVPKLKMDQKNRKETLIEDEVTVVGILRHSEKRPQFSMKNRPDIDFWAYRDVESMAYNHNTAPVYLDAVKDPEKKGYPIGGQTQITLKNEHLNYIITWYSLALFTLILARKAV